MRQYYSRCYCLRVEDGYADHYYAGVIVTYSRITMQRAFFHLLRIRTCYSGETGLAHWNELPHNLLIIADIGLVTSLLERWNIGVGLSFKETNNNSNNNIST